LPEPRSSTNDVSPFDNGITIVTEHLAMGPLRVEDAQEMAGVRPELSSAGCGNMVSTTSSPTSIRISGPAAVAMRAGLRPTDEQAHSELVWRAPG
jgi:hypothetical protein